MKTFTFRWASIVVLGALLMGTSVGLSKQAAVTHASGCTQSIRASAFGSYEQANLWFDGDYLSACRGVKAEAQISGQGSNLGYTQSNAEIHYNGTDVYNGWQIGNSATAWYSANCIGVGIGTNNYAAAWVKQTTNGAVDVVTTSGYDRCSH